MIGVYQAEAGVVGLASVKIHTPSGTFALGVNGSVDTVQSHHEVILAGMCHCYMCEGIKDSHLIFEAALCWWVGG